MSLRLFNLAPTVDLATEQGVGEFESVDDQSNGTQRLNSRRSRMRMQNNKHQSLGACGHQTDLPYQPLKRMARSFRSQKDFRTWLEKNHAQRQRVDSACFKTHARHRGVSYKEALDEALCFGWIDGVRRSLDDDSFTVRFTPRRQKSNWSKVNIKSPTELEGEGRMHAAGLAAFRACRDHSVPYSFESKSITLDRGLERKLRATSAWQYFSAAAMVSGHGRLLDHDRQA